MTRALTEQSRALLEAPLRISRPVETLGRALFLYQAVVLAANERGMAIRERSRFAKDVAVSEETIDAWIERLVRARLIRVLSPSPYLAIALTVWSGSSVVGAQVPQQSGGEQVQREMNARGSSKLQQHAAALSSKAGDRGPGEGVPSNDEIREVLGDPSLDVSTLVGDARGSAIRKALSRVRATPASQIRKSRAALFRYLIQTFSQELDIDER